jgi:3-oxoadipate enol-lactonase
VVREADPEVRLAVKVGVPPRSVARRDLVDSASPLASIDHDEPAAAAFGAVGRLRTASGTSVAYREAGHGPTLVQIHGGGAARENYDLLSPLLARDLHVVDIDLPGYGASDQPAHDRRVRSYALDVAEFIEASPYERVHVHGTSLGGCVAIVLSAARPDLVDRLVLSCTFARADRASAVMRDSWRRAADAGAETLANLTSLQGFSREFWDRPASATTRAAFVEAFERLTPDKFIRVAEQVAGLDLEQEARQIGASTLLVAADEDVICPLRAAPSGLGMTDLERLIPEAQLKIVERCGHFIAFERPDELAELIVSFVAGP